ncbi:hypothetical protein V8E52_010513 [Russula decolorans]
MLRASALTRLARSRTWEGEPINVTRGSQLGDLGERNIVLWADNLAEKEADLINATGSSVLDYVGGAISLEMEIPKILWLKHHMAPDRFEHCQFFDLPDFLTYRATVARTRSLCSLTCKCTYAPGNGWDRAFMSQIGLDAVVQNEFAALGTDVLTAGKPVGDGLTVRAAAELDLEPRTPVSSGVIDAYAGWLGTRRHCRDDATASLPGRCLANQLLSDAGCCTHDRHSSCARGQRMPNQT